MTRQISFLLNNYVYHDGTDTEDPGLLIPRYKAVGRTAPNGKQYPNTFSGKPNENDLVPVRSVITKKGGNLNVVTPDMIGTKFTDFTDGAAIGLSFATGLTENITQGALGLKHGGHERVLLQEGYLNAPKNCEYREEGKWIFLKVRGGELKYPKPDNFVTTGKVKFNEGEVIGTAYATTSPIYKLNALISLMRAKGSNGQRYFEKDNVIVSDCYAYGDGVIKYVESNGEIEVHIGSHKYDYNPMCMYYYPEGTEIKKYQRFCSGVVNMNHAISELSPNVNDIYLIFRKQFYTLTDKDFIKTNVSDYGGTQEELIEMLFMGLTNVGYDSKQDKIEEIEYQGTQSGVLSKKSFYTVLSYGYSSRVVSKALKGELNISGDIMTETILGLLLNNKLDNGNDKN